MDADQDYAYVTELVSHVGIRNKICIANDRVHDKGYHGLVEKLHSSLEYWLIWVAVADYD